MTKRRFKPPQETPVKELTEQVQAVDKDSRSERARLEELSILEYQQNLDRRMLHWTPDLEKEMQSLELKRMLAEAEANGLEIQKIPIGESAFYNKDGSPKEEAFKRRRKQWGWGPLKKKPEKGRPQ